MKYLTGDEKSIWITDTQTEKSIRIKNGVKLVGFNNLIAVEVDDEILIIDSSVILPFKTTKPNVYGVYRKDSIGYEEFVKDLINKEILLDLENNLPIVMLVPLSAILLILDVNGTIELPIELFKQYEEDLNRYYSLGISDTVTVSKILKIDCGVPAPMADIWERHNYRYTNHFNKSINQIRI